MFFCPNARLSFTVATLNYDASSKSPWNTEAAAKEASGGSHQIPRSAQEDSLRMFMAHLYQTRYVIRKPMQEC